MVNRWVGREQFRKNGSVHQLVAIKTERLTKQTDSAMLCLEEENRVVHYHVRHGCLDVDCGEVENRKVRNCSLIVTGHFIQILLFFLPWFHDSDDDGLPTHFMLLPSSSAAGRVFVVMVPGICVFMGEV